MDSSFIPSDDESFEELPELSFFLKRPAVKAAKTRGNKTSLALSESGENASASKANKTVHDQNQSPKKPKQRVLRALEHNIVLLSPVKDFGTPRSKQRRVQKLDDDSEDLEKSFAIFMESPEKGHEIPRLNLKSKPTILLPKRKEKGLLNADNEDYSIFDLKPEMIEFVEEDASKFINSKAESPESKNVESRPTSSYDDRSAFLTFEPKAVSPRKAPPISIPGTPTRSTLPSHGPVSPSKSLSIPLAPFSTSTDEFWSQSTINDWNDQHSPQRPLTSPRKSRRQNFSDSESPTFSTPTKSTKGSRSKSVTTKADKKQFEAKREQLAIGFLAELDATITEGKISEMSQETGGIKIIWSKKLNSTAGMAHWRRESVITTENDGTVKKSYKHHASIELATKVIDDETRLVNTLAHEFCHLANFMISEVKNNPHGKEFKEWAAKCTKSFGNRGVKVTTKHSYTIDYKYVWECTGCGVTFKRHSKSIDPLKQSCGSCRSKLVQIKPAPRKGGTDSEYQAFIKQNFQRIKKEHDKESLGFIMGIVAKQYREQKQTKDEVLDALAEEIAAVKL